MFKDLKASDIKSFHTKCLADANWPNIMPKGLNKIWSLVAGNHQFNTLLWLEEDQARRTNVNDSLIAENKRAIDRYNQKRNDFIEAIDIEILSRASTDNQAPLWTNSETAGSIIDRLSINSLKCFHMKKQTQRTASHEHITLCTQRLLILDQQGENLGLCLDNLLTGIANGTASYKLYRQFKMYNDKNLNPYLYSSEK